MKLSIVRYTKSYSIQWNGLVNIAKNGLFLFNRAYLEYHENRFTDHSLMIYKGEKLIALLPANEIENKVCSHGGLTFGGMLYTNELKTNDALQIFELFMSYYREQGFEELTYKAIPGIYCNYPCQEVLYALFRHNAVLYRRDLSSVVALSNPIRFSESKRQAINKCALAGIKVEENNDFTLYWQLLDTVLQKFGVDPVHTIEEISFLKRHFEDKIRLFEARLEGELLAGVLIYDYGNVVHTQYMANSEKGRKLGALDFINARLITGEFKGRSYFSFGTSTLEEGRILNEGLLQHKEMMGGRAIVNDFYKISLK